MTKAVGFALMLIACTSSPDQTAVTGTTAFTPTSTVMLPKALHCSSTEAPNALTIVIADTDLTANGCPSQFDILPHTLRLEVANPSEPIAAGTTFPILDEKVSDEDLCGNVQDKTKPIGIAMLGVCPSGSCSADYWASTGSITVASLSATSASGSFDVTLVDSDGDSHGSLSGTFAATSCP